MITITDSAADMIAEKTALKDGAIGLRLTIKSTGCSGHSYKMEHAMEEDLNKDDKFTHNEAVLYIPKTDSWMLLGMTIDYQVTDMKEGFEFINPNETGRCGCGESFQVQQPKP
jgi:iron-sulfur cluster assembly protein